MKIFLSGVEQGWSPDGVDRLIESGVKLHWNLMSYYYIRADMEEFAERVRDNSELILIDSGAHSFQFGKKVDFETYTQEYADFIKRFDRPNVLGYFEMDIENVIGYPKVLELRKRLERVSDKIIPVWHPLRGIDDYEKMCKAYAGKVIAIGGFRNTDIKDEQYLMFIKVARKYNCKVHCLGMTRNKVLDKVPFDYTDSCAWAMTAIYGKTLDRQKLPHADGKEKRTEQIRLVYTQAMQMQERYYARWRKECKD